MAHMLYTLTERRMHPSGLRSECDCGCAYVEVCVSVCVLQRTCAQHTQPYRNKPSRGHYRNAYGVEGGREGGWVGGGVCSSCHR